MSALLEGIFTVVVEAEVKVKDDRLVAVNRITGAIKSKSPHLYNFLHIVPKVI